MITSEIAKALKDNGFEYTSHSFDACASRCLFEDDEFIHFPDLSELIEAVGDDFEGLLKGNFNVWNWETKKYDYVKGFFAGKIDGTDGSSLDVDYVPHGYGKTPEEAVAYLFLALNKK